MEEMLKFVEDCKADLAKIRKELISLEERELAVLIDLYTPRQQKPKVIRKSWDDTEINF